MNLRPVRLTQLASRPNAPGLLPISPSTIWKLVKEGKFPPPYKIGQSVLWDLDEIELFIKAQMEDSRKELSASQERTRVALNKLHLKLHVS